MNELKKMLNDNSISLEEKRIMHVFLECAKFTIETRIIMKIINSNKKIDDLINSIDNLLNEYNESLKKENNKILIGRLKSKIRRLNALKNSIKDNNYEMFTKDILDKSSMSENKVIKMCSYAFLDSYKEFKMMFGNNILESEDNKYKINSKTIDAIFDIINDSSVFERINKYVKKYLNRNKLIKQKQELERRLNIYKIYMNNFSLVETYIRTLISYKKMLYISEPIKKTYEENEKIIGYIESSSILDRLTQFYQLMKRKSENEEINKYLTNQKVGELDLKNKLNELEKKMKDIGLSVLVDEFNSKIIIKDDEVSYSLNNELEDGKIGSFIFADYKEISNSKFGNKHGMGIDELTNLINKYEEKIKEEDTQLEKEKYDMDAKSRLLIEYNMEDCIKLVKLKKSEKRFNISPIISMYILNLVAKIKNIDLDTIINTLELDINKNEYNELVENKIKEMNNQVEDIRNEVKPSIFNL